MFFYLELTSPDFHLIFSNIKTISPNQLEHAAGPSQSQKVASSETEKTKDNLVRVSVEVQTDEDLIDAEVAFAKRMEMLWMEEKKRLEKELREVSRF